MLTSEQKSTWYPVAASTDLVPRHIFHGQLWGQELAIWRADDGHVNVWENRCLHRGVRLSIGINLGHELMCQYHGWRYANRTAGCTYIPAHPADAPARTICNRTYQVVEAGGLVWTSLAPQAEPQLPTVPKNAVQLRAIEIAAAPELVAAKLPKPADVVFHIQPVDAGKTILRGYCLRTAGSALEAQKTWDRQLCDLRDQIEAGEGAEPPSIPHEIKPVDAQLAAMPDRNPRQARLRVRVAAKKLVANDVMAIHLEALEGDLPAFQPGAHLDVHLPNGLIRQYSITNGPADVTHYRIAVKREAAGEGGSIALHDHVQLGDVLAISESRHNFPLRRDQLNVKLIAGGIGITPLLAMAKTLAVDHCPFELHCFAQSEDHLPFKAELSDLGGRVHQHLGLGPAASRERFAQIIGEQQEKETLYVCGPPAMLDAVRAVAAELGWPDDDVRFEYFQNERQHTDEQPFSVALARSAITVEVAAGTSIVEALRPHNVIVPTSCEKGACGTCLVSVIEGEIDHRDVYLSAKEQAAGDRLTACCSRAAGRRLVLDL